MYLSTISDMDLAGGAACIDLVNTIVNYGKEVERIHTYADVLILVERSGLLEKETVQLLHIEAVKQPKIAEKVLATIRKLRLAMLKIFQALAEHQLHQLPASDLTVFNSFTTDALSKQQFIAGADHLELLWNKSTTDLNLPVSAFTLSAVQLLTLKDQHMIKQCGACAWLFLDETKNHRRKWCAMQTCGSNEKAKRYYERKRTKIKANPSVKQP